MWGTIASIAGPLIGRALSGGGGGGGGSGSEALEDLARHTQFESWQAMTAEAKEKIEPAKKSTFG